MPEKIDKRIVFLTFKKPILGLPDGIFSYQKSQFGYILEGLGMEKAGIFLAI
jgi:hypothetical protein